MKIERFRVRRLLISPIRFVARAMQAMVSIVLHLLIMGAQPNPYTAYFSDLIIPLALYDLVLLGIYGFARDHRTSNHRWVSWACVFLLTSIPFVLYRHYFLFAGLDYYTTPSWLQVPIRLAQAMLFLVWVVFGTFVYEVAW